MQESEPRDRSLAAALRAVAEDDATRGASAVVETTLLSEVRAIAWARRRRRYTTAVGIAAALLVAVVVPTWRSIVRAPGPTTVAAMGEVTTAFFPLIYGNVPLGDGQLVRLEVPRTALAAFGLGSMDSIEGRAGTVLADVLVGEDGLARAVRFVRPVTRQEQKP